MGAFLIIPTSKKKKKKVLLALDQITLIFEDVVRSV